MFFGCQHPDERRWTTCDTGSRARELRAQPERPIWNKPLEGLFITAGATIVVANLMNLESISTMGSAGFLIIFAVVNLAEARTANQRGSPGWISVLAAAACLAALALLIGHSSFAATSVLLAMVALSFGIEAVFRRSTGRGRQAKRRPRIR